MCVCATTNGGDDAATEKPLNENNFTASELQATALQFRVPTGNDFQPGAGDFLLKVGRLGDESERTSRVLVNALNTDILIYIYAYIPNY